MFLKVIADKTNNLTFYLLSVIFFLESCNKNDSIPSKPCNNNLQLLAIDSKTSRPKENITNTNPKETKIKRAESPIEAQEITKHRPKEEPMTVSTYDYQEDLDTQAKEQVLSLINNCLDFSSECIEGNSATTEFAFPFNDFYFQIWLGDCHRQHAESVVKNPFLKLYHFQLALNYYDQAASKKHIQKQKQTK